MTTSTHTPTYHHISAKDHQRILDHYHLALPLMARQFPETPLVYAAFPRGLGGFAVYQEALHRPPPAGEPTIDVETSKGPRTYLMLTRQTMERAVEHGSAVEFYGWGCHPNAPQTPRFGRILLEPDREFHDSLVPAANVLRELLEAEGRDSIPLLDGERGMALWIPMGEPTSYDELRHVLRGVCAKTVAADKRFSLDPNTSAGGRIHLHVDSNTPGRFSCLPYGLRAGEKLLVCTPVRWEELASVQPGDFTAETFPKRLAEYGDVFERCLEEFASRRPTAGRCGAAIEPKHGRPIEPQGHTLRAVAIILQDGKPRDAKQLLAEAVGRHLLPPSTKEKYIYSALLEYIVRTSGHGHRPFVVQDGDRRFRLNEPRDEWPESAAPPEPAPDAATQEVIERLESTARGSAPEAFERAVCDAFARLRFVATHVGGRANPDGYADAPLGVFGYRAMLECKSGATVVSNPDALEAAKFRERYGAQVCAIVGSRFSEKLELVTELQTHQVAAFSIEDLKQLLRARSNPWEMRRLFEPGFASDRIGDLLWERAHGTAKRVDLICKYLCEGGWAAQTAFAKAEHPRRASEAPRLTVDAAMLLVDQRLGDEGSAAACTRAEVEAAFADLTRPHDARAVWTSDARDAIVLTGASLR